MISYFSFVINAIAVVIGSIIGLLFRKVFKKEYCDSVLKAMGLVVIIVGLAGILENMLTFVEGKIITSGTLLIIASIAIGTFIGEFLKIDTHLNNFAKKVEVKLNKNDISEGFVTGTLLYCVGAMAIIGSLNASLGNPETIYLKSCLDGVTSIILASTLGFGVLLSAGSVFIYQGLLTLIFFLLEAGIPEDVVSELASLVSLVGYVLVMGIGFNFIVKDKLKIANMLPALLIPIIYYLVKIWLG